MNIHSVLSDQEDNSPAGFFFSNPNNIIENNEVAGSEYYGFWYNLQYVDLSTDTITCP